MHINCRCFEGTLQVMRISEEIRPVALAISELRLSEGISKSDRRQNNHSVENSVNLEIFKIS